MGDSYNVDGGLVPLSPCTEDLPPPSGKWYVEYYEEGEFECVQVNSILCFDLKEAVLCVADI